MKLIAIIRQFFLDRKIKRKIKKLQELDPFIYD